MKILIIDNYDSLTNNLYQFVGEVMTETGIAFKLDVERKDWLSLSEIKKKKYDRVIISPGPGGPDDKKYFGVCAKILLKLGQKIPVLGVCFGLQRMVHYFGGKVVRTSFPMHGKISIIQHDGKGVFSQLPQGIEVMRYHSLMADLDALPEELTVTASVVATLSSRVHTSIREIPFHLKKMEAVNEHMLVRAPIKQLVEIMGLRHKKYPIEGIQFHPESSATKEGKRMIENFIFQYGKNI